jgi:hypothetical protein
MFQLVKIKSRSLSFFAKFEKSDRRGDLFHVDRPAVERIETIRTQIRKFGARGGDGSRSVDGIFRRRRGCMSSFGVLLAWDVDAGHGALHRSRTVRNDSFSAFSTTAQRSQATGSISY